MEKSLKIVSLKDKQTDYAFWMTKSYQERLEALELLRQQYINFKGDAQQGLQRVCRITNRKQG